MKKSIVNITLEELAKAPQTAARQVLARCTTAEDKADAERLLKAIGIKPADTGKK